MTGALHSAPFREKGAISETKQWTLLRAVLTGAFPGVFMGQDLIARYLFLGFVMYPSPSSCHQLCGLVDPLLVSGFLVLICQLLLLVLYFSLAGILFWCLWSRLPRIVQLMCHANHKLLSCISTPFSGSCVLVIVFSRAKHLNLHLLHLIL